MDCVVSALVLGALYFVSEPHQDSRARTTSDPLPFPSTSEKIRENAKYACTGVLFAFAVYLRLFPILYLPAVFFALNSKFNILSTVHYLLRSPSACLRLPVSLPRAARDFVRSVTAAQIIFLVSWTVTLGALVTHSYMQYGWLFLYESYLYHFTRHDHRHNMSVFSTWGTLVTPQAPYDHAFSEGGVFKRMWSIGSMRLLSLLGSKALPIVVMVLLAQTDIYLALFSGTLIFVAFGSVLTVQYMQWFMALLPPAVVNSRHSLRERTPATGVLQRSLPFVYVWHLIAMAAVGIWVRFSDDFEHKGSFPAFFLMHIPNLLLFGAHLGLLVTVWKLYEPRLLGKGEVALTSQRSHRRPG